MGIDCGFDIYPPLERTRAKQAQYELFLREVLAAYGLRYGDEANQSAVGDSDNVVRVNAESNDYYIEFMVGEHPYLPRRCEDFLRFSSKVSGSSAAEPHIRAVCKIAKQHLGDRVYFWHETNEFCASIHQFGCYNWCEIRAASKRAKELKLKEQEEGWKEEQERKDMHLGELHRGSDGANTMPVGGEKLYAIKPIPGKGQGVIATSNISKGTRILLEAPLFRLTDSVEDVRFAESAVLREVKGLSRDQQRAFFALQNAYGRRYSPLLGIAKTNMLPLSGNDDGNGGLFLEASRINHSCRPNAQHTWNTTLGCLTVHALHDMETGCEITISYMSGISRGYLERQRYLKESFSFSCACELCSLPLSGRRHSDSRLAQIRTIEENVNPVDVKEVSKRPSELFLQARQLSELLKEEGILDMRVSKAWFTAFQIAAVTGDKARSKAFAERAYATRKLLSGDDNPTSIAFKHLAERPVDYPLYGGSMRCYGEPPRDMSGEEFENWLWNTRGGGGSAYGCLSCRR